MSKILSHPWALPTFSIIAAAVFITVHLTAGEWREAPNMSTGNLGVGGEAIETGKEVAGGDLATDEGGGGVRPFTYVPTSSPNENEGFVPVPTTIVFGHNVPQNEGDGEDLTWNIPFGEPTPDPALLYDPATPPALINHGDGPGGGWGYPPGSPTPDPALLNGGNNGSPVKVTWNIPFGQPTPDPAMLLDPATPPSMINNGNPINLAWNIPLGQPTPDPALLNPSNGKPINLAWNIPLGQPTPDPAQLNPANGTPINLSWNIPLGQPTPDPAQLNPANGSPINLAWNIPLGQPTPDPALLNPSNGKPINLAWNIPLGEPTPDPALLNPSNGNPINLAWGIPLGEPTPDPALLNPSNGKPVILTWDIPEGEPTPDPAQLNPSNGKPVVIKWNIPLGMPTPDPAQLIENIGKPIVMEFVAPYPRPLEFGTISPSLPGDTLAPSSAPSLPVPAVTSQPQTVPPTLKPEAPVPSPTDPPTPEPTNPPTPKPTNPPTPKPTPELLILTLPPPPPPQPLPTAPPVLPPVPLPTPQPIPATPPPVIPPTPSPIPPPPPPPPPPPQTPPAPLPPPPTSLPPPVPPPPVPPPPVPPPPVPPPPVPPPPVPPPPVPPPPAPGPIVPPPPPVPPPPVPPPPAPGPTIPPPPPVPPPLSTPDSAQGTVPAPGSGPGPGSAVWVSGRGGEPTWYSGGGAVKDVNPVPLVIPHNQIFLEGCNPLVCSLIETADFHAMSNEDESIYEIFYTNPIKCCRVIVEVGAGDGDRNSFSHFFEEGLKWRSLLIEANVDVFQQLRANRPNATTINGAFCESSHLQYANQAFSSLDGSVEISSELHSPPKAGAAFKEVPCLSMDTVFAEYGITKVDVMVVRLQGDALAFIRAMDWTVRVDIWVVLMHGASKADRDELVRTVLKGNEYVQAEWDIKRWCNENGSCLNNEVFLRKGFNPLPCEIKEAMAAAGASPSRNLRGKK